MAVYSSGGPERAPEGGTNPPASRAVRGFAAGVRATQGITDRLDAFADRFAPHRGDHGGSLFNHPSTNRGGTPGTLNGTGAPARVTSPFSPSSGDRTSGGLGGPRRSTSPLRAAPEQGRASSGIGQPPHGGFNIDIPVTPSIGDSGSGAPRRAGGPTR